MGKNDNVVKGKVVEKELKLEFVKMVQEKHAIHKMKEQEKQEIYEREEPARKYIADKIRQGEERMESIKNVLCVLFIIIVGIVFLLIIGNKSRSEINSTTPSKDELVSIKEYDGSVYFMRGELQGNHVVLEDGNIHEVDKSNANYSSEPIYVTVTLNDNGTEDVTDDIVINIR